MATAVNQSQFATLRGVTKGRVSQWKKQGLLKFDTDGLLVLVDESNAMLDAALAVDKRAARGMTEDLPPHQREVPAGASADTPNTSNTPRRNNDEFREYNQARTEGEKHRARMAALDLAEREGELVNRAVVIVAAGALAQLIATGLDMLPARIGSQVANEVDPAKREEIIESECRLLREKFAEQAEALLKEVGPDA